MGTTVNVALSKLIYWYDAPRIQTWPALLAKVDPEIECRTLMDFGRAVTSERMTDQDHLADHDYVRNFPGLEIRSNRLVLRGVGMLKHEEKSYRLSSFAKKLADEYEAQPEEKEWARLLARIVLTREPRTRALIYCLSKPGAVMSFAGNSWFTGGLKKTCIDMGQAGKVYPFSDSKKEGRLTLQDILLNKGWWCLGDWKNSFLLQQYDNCRITGYKKEEISLHRIGQALRAPCEIFHYLGVLKNENNECYLDHEAAIDELGEDLGRDFTWNAPSSGKNKSFKDLLQNSIEKLKNDTGFIVASQLRTELASEGIANPDQAIAELEKDGYLEIEDESFGQGRHGEGLYSDPRKQLIKIRIHGGK